jgi:hydroxymethylpyrimidine/phosphomethylpyrimidine kinase
VWERFTYHDFVDGMGQGSLPIERFKEYLVQDYLYLVSIESASHDKLLIGHLGPICAEQRIGSLQGEEHGVNICSKFPWILLFMAYLIQPIQSARIVLHIEREMALHLEYCASFGLTKQEMENHPETIGMFLLFIRIFSYL